MSRNLISYLKGLFPIKSDEAKDESSYNPSLLSVIQSQGGVKFEPNYVKLGDGYIACLHVYKYQNVVNDFWLEPILNMPNVLATVDVANANKRDAVEKINKALAEQNARFETAKSNIERIDAQKQYAELHQLYENMTVGEILKHVHLRLYVKGKTLEDLEVNARKVIEELESMNFRATTFLNEQEWEWESLFTSYHNQSKYLNKRKGKEIPATTLAGGYPFHFTSLDDVNGMYLGTTFTNGTVVFDLFHKDKNRKYYNALMVGSMGSGKSTLLKKTVLDTAMKGNKVRIIDVTGEFGELVNQLGGKQIALDGSEGIINPLEVFRTVVNEDGTTNEELSFTQHLSKLTVFYNYLKPSADSDEKSTFSLLLRKLYVEYGMWSEEKEHSIAITSFQSEKYPTFSALLNLVRKSLYEDFSKKIIHSYLGEDEAARISRIELTIENLVKNYGKIFDGISSIDSFNDELVVSFPIRNLTNLQSEIFQAQIFNIMNMLWDGMIVNGAPQFRAFNQGHLDFEDATRYLIVIDEAHHIINTRSISQPAVMYLQRFMREARKYFGGIFFVSHLISDFVPTGSNSENAENVKKLFQLTQYKFIAQQDAESVPIIQQVFDGQLTNSESKIIPTLETGNVVLSISGLKNIVLKVDISKEEIKLFGGGA